MFGVLDCRNPQILSRGIQIRPNQQNVRQKFPNYCHILYIFLHCHRSIIYTFFCLGLRITYFVMRRNLRTMKF